MDVVGEWQASHFGWSDTLSIWDNGRFARGNGDEGSWHVNVEGGKTILALDWDRWVAGTRHLLVSSHDSSHFHDDLFISGSFFSFCVPRPLLHLFLSVPCSPKGLSITCAGRREHAAAHLHPSVGTYT
jgi:hypothetical protein